MIVTSITSLNMRVVEPVLVFRQQGGVGLAAAFNIFMGIMDEECMGLPGEQCYLNAFPFSLSLETSDTPTLFNT